MMLAVRLRLVAWARRRYGPARRLRLARFTALVAAVVYTGRALQQVLLQPLPSTSRVITYDFGVYLAAARALNRGADPYALPMAACNFRVDICGYIYPTLLAELLRPLALLDDATAGRLWLIVSQACVMAAILVLRRALPQLSGPGSFLLLAGALLFLPLYQALYSLQVGPLLALLLSVAILGEATGRHWLAGVSLGVGSVTRVTPLLVAPALARRTRQLGGLIALVITIAGLLAGLYLLTPYTAEFFTNTLPALAGGPPRFDNESLSGFLARTVPGGAGIHWIPAATALSVVVITLAASIRSRHAHAGLLTLAGFIAAMPIASAITWQHHLVSELPVMAMLIAIAPGPRTWGVVLVAYLALWVDPRVVNDLNLLGMLILWIATLALLWRPEGAAEEREGQLSAANP
jgi:hypothetical protein